MLKTVVLINIFVQAVILFPGLFDKFKVQKKSICLKFCVVNKELFKKLTSVKTHFSMLTILQEQWLCVLAVYDYY